MHRPQGELVAEIAALDIAFPTVQPMPNERYLILGGRCRRTTDGVEKNGSVVDNTGRELVRATVGDGIQHALATPSGSVWLGFFDEGVYGNFGWGFDGAEPLGTHGLVRVGPKLTQEWSFPFDQGLAPIDDCYALNVDGETAWACYYSGFPVVRIEEGSIRTWRNDVAGARALITDGRQLALIGGYGEDRNRVVYGELHDEQFAPTSTHELVLPDGAPLAGATMVGRGPSPHVLTDSAWYQLSLEDAATA